MPRMSPEDREIVIEALNDVLRFERTACEQFHDQEHWFEPIWPGLKKLFHCFTEKARDRRRVFLDKLSEMHSRPRIEFAEFNTQDGVIEALEATRDLLEDARAACVDAYEQVDKTDDYVTVQLLIDNQKCLEKSILKAEKHLARIDAIGLPGWLAEQV